MSVALMLIVDMKGCKMEISERNQNGLARYSDETENEPEGEILKRIHLVPSEIVNIEMNEPGG